jgi:hypothetical protein
MSRQEGLQTVTTEVTHIMSRDSLVSRLLGNVADARRHVASVGSRRPLPLLFKFCRSHCTNARTGLHYTHDSSFSPHSGLSTMRRDDTEALPCAPRHPGWAGNVLTVCGSPQRAALSCFTNYNDASMYLGPITIPRQGSGIRCIVLGLQPHISRAPTDVESKWILSTRLLTIFPSRHRKELPFARISVKDDISGFL